MPDVGGGRLRHRARRGPVGLEIDDQNLVFSDHQAVDLSGNQDGYAAWPIEPSDDRHLGAAAARENGREPGVADQAKQVGGECVMLARSPVAGIAAKKTKRGVAPPLGRDVGQRL